MWINFQKISDNDWLRILALHVTDPTESISHERIKLLQRGYVIWQFDEVMHASALWHTFSNVCWKRKGPMLIMHQITSYQTPDIKANIFKDGIGLRLKSKWQDLHLCWKNISPRKTRYFSEQPILFKHLAILLKIAYRSFLFLRLSNQFRLRIPLPLCTKFSARKFYLWE